jgi:NADPH2:quinone reductase
MKAIVIDEFGGPDKLREAELETPEPGPGEVRIRLSHTSVNPVDWKIREGRLQTRFPHEFPLIVGWDAAGTVDKLGEGASGFAVGDRVYAYCRKPVIRWGTYAEFVTVPAAAVAPMPERLTPAEAATIPLVGLTAWQSLFDTAQLAAGQTVLIHAAAGGVGGIAVQFAKSVGARVIGTASAANHAYVRSLGADEAIDYAGEDFVAAVRKLVPGGVDVVFDTVGGDTQARSYAALKKGGMLVSITAPPDAAEAEKHGVRPGYVFVSPNGEQLRRIGAQVDAGKVRPPEIHVMSIRDAAAAHKRSQEGHVRGKIVLAIDFAA